MKISAKTDIGLVRNQNQDSYATGEIPDGISWAVVCDGMGGAAGGAVASSMAVRMISERIVSACRKDMTEGYIRNICESVIQSANLSIYNVSRSNPELNGMGTTAVIVITEGNNAYISHVGDSRAYRVSKTGEIVQLTNDHSVVQALVDRGEITPEQARSHPERNVITRAVGVGEWVKVDFGRYQFDSDDYIVICSDGLSGYVTDKEISDAVIGAPFNSRADSLVKLAIQNGGGDNITVVIISH